MRSAGPLQALATETTAQPPTRRPDGTKRGRPSEDEKKQRIDNLIALTAQIFVEEGYGAITTRRISEGAGISAKSIYAWFPDKLALMSEVMSRLSSKLSSSRQPLPLTDLTLEEALYHQAKAMLGNLLQPESLAVARFLNRDGYRFPEFTEFIRNQNLSVNIARIREILERKLTRPCSDADLQGRAMQFSYLVLGEVSRAIVHDLDLPGPEKVDQYAREVARLFCFGIEAALAPAGAISPPA